MPDLICLREKHPLAQIVAEHLLDGARSPIRDLSDTVVLVPTAGAGRRLKAALVHLAGDAGLLSPRILAPMQFLAECCPEGTASRFDSLVAWTQVIEEMDDSEFSTLFPGFAEGTLRGTAARVATTLMGLTDLLAEAGRSPDASDLAKIFAEDDRWTEIAELFGRVRQKLAAVGLTEVNASYIRTAKGGKVAPDVTKILLAGVPDLTPLLQIFLKNLESQGIKITILVHTPDCEDGVFDAWGRPDPACWKNWLLPMPNEMIGPCESSEVEAAKAAELSRTVSGSVGVVMADPTQAPLMERAFEREGIRTYDPAGVALSSSEAALVLRVWPEFCRTGSLSALRQMAETPLFLDLLKKRTRLPGLVVLNAIDFMAHGLIRDNLPSRQDLDLLELRKDRPEGLLNALQIVVHEVENLRREFPPGRSTAALPEFLSALYADRKLDAHSAEAVALTELAVHVQTLLQSPLESHTPRHDLLQTEINKARYFLPKPEGCVELHGWLEASWLESPHMILCGCTEGNLPGTVEGHPFLPDQARKRLGIASNDERFARDVYLMHCLLAIREPGNVRILFAQTGLEGDPHRPSRLLFRCVDKELPGRVMRVQQAVAAPMERPAAQRVWRMKLPRKEPPTSLRVTGFKEYLQCPVRFYLKNRLGMQAVDSQKAEMDASDYGTVMHEVMENFAGNAEMVESRNALQIENFILEELDRVLTVVFGGIHSVALRAQRESLRARLRRFSHMQAEERRKGWRIVKAELPFLAEDTLEIGGLKITAKLDRIEINEQTGRRRILDYKSFNQLKTPEKTHLASGKTAPVIESALTPDGQQWVDLQLPLYRALAEFKWPDDGEPTEVGYFLLPPKIEDSSIELLPLDEARYRSALACAGDIAERVRGGIYWPPAEKLRYDDFEALFPMGDIAEAFDEESIDFLKGDGR